MRRSHHPAGKAPPRASRPAAVSRSASARRITRCSSRSASVGLVMIASLQLEQLARVVADQLLPGLVAELEAVHLVQALLPREPVGPPDGAVLPHATPDEVDDLGLEILRHPRVDPEPHVVPLVADRAQLLDPWPARVRAEDPQRREVAGDLVEERSEEHTSELQSRRELVCRLLLEKK